MKSLMSLGSISRILAKNVLQRIFRFRIQWLADFSWKVRKCLSNKWYSMGLHWCWGTPCASRFLGEMILHFWRPGRTGSWGYGVQRVRGPGARRGTCWNLLALAWSMVMNYSKLMQIDSSSVGSRKKNIRRQLRQIHFDPKVDAPSFELPLNSLQEGKTGYPFIDAWWGS